MIASRVLLPALLALIAPVLAGCGSGGGNPSPREYCNEIVAATCNKFSDCGGTAGLGLLGDYSSVADCTSQRQTVKCGAVTVGCSDGASYHGDNAKQCVDQYTAVECATALDSIPDVCSHICTIPPPDVEVDAGADAGV